MFTIQTIAAAANAMRREAGLPESHQQYEVAAWLDLGRDYTSATLVSDEDAAAYLAEVEATIADAVAERDA